MGAIPRDAPGPGWLTMPRAPSPDLLNAALVALRGAALTPTPGSRLDYHHLPIAHARTLLRVAAHGIGKADLLFAIDHADAAGLGFVRLTPEAHAALLAQFTPTHTTESNAA